MDRLREFFRKVRMMLHRAQLQQELEEEMHLHLELRQRERVEAGSSASAARMAAYRTFGNQTAIRERSVMAWGWEWLESLVQDVVYGVRSMMRSPVLTGVALLSLALGIGANTAIFSFLDAVMLRSLPVQDPSQLVLLGAGDWRGISDGFWVTELYSYPFYRALQKDNSVFSDVGASFSMMNRVYGKVDGRSETEPMKVSLVSGTYFSMLGVPAFMGRTLTDEDDRTEGDHPVVVVSYGWWKRSLASDPDVLSKRLKLGDTVFNIVGVASPEFFGTRVGEAPDMWVPMSMIALIPPHSGSYKGKWDEELYVMGRLKPGVTLEQASSNVDVLYRQIMRSFPNSEVKQDDLVKLDKLHVPLTPMAKGLSSLRRQFSEPLKILMGLTAVVLLIACANIANLLLARSTVRVREFAVRQALGAGRLRLIRQLLTESFVLAVAGGALGVGLAAMANRVLLRMVSGRREMLPLDVSINTRLLVFTLVVTVFTALLFGILPALRSTELDLTDALKDGRGASGKGMKSRLAKSIVITQVAFSLVLLVGAGLFVRSLINLNKVDTGFNRESVLLLRMDASSAGYREGEPRLTAMYKEMEERVGAVHGVSSASFASFIFNEGSWNGSIIVPGVQFDRDLNVKHNVVGDRYFETMQIPLLAGRAFGPEDTAGSHKVAIVSERLAKRFFPGLNPIGRRYKIGGPNSDWDVEIIGVVKDVKFGSLSENPEVLDYVAYAQRKQYEGDFVVRYTGDFSTVSADVQRAIHSVEPNLPITAVTTLDAQVANSITQQRTVAQLSTFFGLLAVFLSCIGIYGLMSYLVGRRTNEIGIRMAVGAAQSDVRWMVMREIGALVIVGVLIGVPLTLVGGRVISNLLFGLSANDLASLLISVVVLLAVGLLAGYLPARRAAKVDPMTALRCE
jgi:predicted permease